MLENNPKISIIFPIYNNEEYLERCIRSVMNQSLKEIEMILVDDGSTDNAPEICDNLAKEDNRIHVIHKDNEGVAIGENLGIDIAKGDYIAFVEADDYVAKEMYEKLYDLAKETDADVVKCGFYYCNGDRKDEATFLYPLVQEGQVFRACDKPQIFLHHSSMWAGIYKREFLNKNGIRNIVTPSASYTDFSWSVMVYAYAKAIAVVHKAFYFYTSDNPNSSWQAVGEKCFYKPYHCMQANRILREASIFDLVKEEISYAEFKNCMFHARAIREDLRKQYFEKFREVILDVSQDGLSYKYFSFWQKPIVRIILDNNYDKFSDKIEKQIHRRLMMKNLENMPLTKKGTEYYYSLKRKLRG